MSISNVNSAFAAYQYANRAQKSTTGKTGFMEQLNSTAESSAATRMEEYTEYLKARYGAGVMVKSVGKDQRSFDSLGAGTAGTGNVVIAPNILEQMANDPEKAAYYEGKIQYYFDSLPRLQAQMSIMGHEIHSSGIVIHEDGTVTHYVSGDLKPEVRAKIEAQIKKEQEEKRARRKKYMERSQEAAEKRRELAKIQNQKRTMAEILQNRFPDTETNYFFIEHSQAIAATFAAYESGIGTPEYLP